MCVRRGNAELWPWGIGKLCRRGPSVLDASAVPPQSRAEIRETKVWTTADGTELHVTEMETSHLENCIAYCDRKLF